MSKKIFGLGDVVIVGGVECVANHFEYNSLLGGWSVVFNTPTGNELQLSLSYIEQSLGV